MDRKCIYFSFFYYLFLYSHALFVQGYVNGVVPDLQSLGQIPQILPGTMLSRPGSSSYVAQAVTGQSGGSSVTRAPPPPPKPDIGSYPGPPAPWNLPLNMTLPGEVPMQFQSAHNWTRALYNEFQNSSRTRKGIGQVRLATPAIAGLQARTVIDARSRLISIDS